MTMVKFTNQMILNEVKEATKVHDFYATDRHSRTGEDRIVLRVLRQWLARLRLLEGVPFAYLVADSELLPPESIRFFYLVRNWSDALVEGALSVGTLNSPAPARPGSVAKENDADDDQ